MTSLPFTGWLRGFLDGVGDRELTKKQVKRIIAEANTLLDPSSEDVPEESSKKLTRTQLLALGGGGKGGEPPPPAGLGDLPTVERQG